MPKNVLKRYEAIKAMNTLVKCLNNEEAYYNRWIYVVPDEASDDELMEIAASKPTTLEDGTVVDIFEDAAVVFLQLMNEYGPDGLYVGDAVYGDL